MEDTEFDKDLFGHTIFYGRLDRDGRSDRKLEAFLQHPQRAGLTSLRYFITYRATGRKGLVQEDQGLWKLTYESTDAPKFYVYENRSALPPAYLANMYIITDNEEESLRAIRENISRLSYVAVLENGTPSFPSATVPKTLGQARITKYGLNEVELQVETVEPSLVVLTDSYYPGWTAFVDGIRKPIWRANSLFRAVEVPAGNHVLIFRYRPASLRSGTAVSLASFMLILVGLLIERRHASRRLTGAG